MSASELGRETGIEKKQLKRMLASLVRSKAVAFRRTGVATASRSNPLGFYRLTAKGQAELLRRVLAERSESGQLQPGQRWVRAEVGSSGIPDLMAAFSESELVASAQWIARTEGDAHGFLFVFGPDRGSQPADNLTAALARRSGLLSSGVVAEIESPDAFLRRASSILGWANARCARGQDQS